MEAGTSSWLKGPQPTQEGYSHVTKGTLGILLLNEPNQSSLLSKSDQDCCSSFPNVSLWDDRCQLELTVVALSHSGVCLPATLL